MHEPKSRTEHSRPKDRIGYHPASDALTGQRVLVVDDEPDIRDLISLMLKTRGVDAIVAGNGEEGRKVLLDHPDGIDAVLLDLTMPDTDPVALLATIRSMSSDTPVLLMSGYAHGAALTPEAHGFAGFLQKPFTPQALFDALHDL
jgi:DNA-binding NtrC family response regulator